MKALMAVAGGLVALAVSVWIYVVSVTAEDLIRADDIEEFNRYASIARMRSAKAIPMFVEVLDDSLRSKYNVFSYGKVNSSIYHLHALAAKGTTDIRSVPMLIRALEEQPAIEDTLVTADTLRMITGLDVGYDADFVSTYTNDDEAKRREMVAKWKAWGQAHSLTP
jgi:hypothetical protein